MKMNQYLNPYTNADRWLRGNLHAHTTCGRFMDISESGRMYARLGYDFLAVTDHNRACTPAQARGWQQAAGLVVVPGEENGGTDHMIELGVHDVTSTPSDDYVVRAAALREAGGFVIACHPQEYGHGDENVRRAAEVLHAIEIYNGLRELRGTDEACNVALWDELLTRGERLWAVATDDFHCQYTSPGHGWVSVQVPADHAGDVTWQLIVEQLKRGAFYASTGPAFDTLQLRDGELDVVVDERTKHVLVIGPGGETLAEADDGRLTWRVAAGLPYFRVEARRGIKRAWSQPFFAAG